MNKGSDPQTGAPKTRAFVWIGVAALAIGLGLLATPPEFARPTGAMQRALPRLPGPVPNFRTLLFMLGVGSIVWYSAAIALPVLVLGARRLDVERHGWTRMVLIAAGTLVGLIAISSLVQYVWIYRGAPMRPGLSAYAPQALRQNLLPWIALLGLVTAIEARRRSLHSRIDRESLRAEVAEQRLIALTGQLHPHFLFNTLQGISTLIHRDPDAADEMLAKLSDLLRDLLRHRDHVLVPLGDELRYARTYLEIAQLRFADRLQFRVDADAALERASVPLFILQPLVENALAHGIGGRTDGGCVTVKAVRTGDRLVLEVADDGAGLTTSTTLREGIGLSNTRERLRASFGEDHRFALAPGNGAGAVARIDIPFRLHESPVEPR